MHILVIRLSALGDIVHALPALTDLRRALPQATIDFAVDERFVELAELHKHVDRVLSFPLKRWKKHIGRLQTWREVFSTVQSFRKTKYDCVIDVHGVDKSAIVAWLARADRIAGPDESYSPDWLPPRIYSRLCKPDSWTPRTQWVRQIAAQALDLSISGSADFGLRSEWMLKPQAPVVLVTNTAGPERLWDQEEWVALGRQLIAANLRLVFPWGNAAERGRVDAILSELGSSNCLAGPAQSIRDWARDLAQARLVVGVDTGLLHIAAASGTPCVGIFTNSDPGLLISQNQQWTATAGGPGLLRPTHLEVLSKIQFVLDKSTDDLAGA